MATAYLAIGSNLGDRMKNIESAIALLEEHGIDVLRRSTLIETAPVGGPSGQGMFLNGALKVATRHGPRELLAALKSIEQRLGRVKTVANGPRPIDLDILLYDQLTLDTPELTIPHPRMHQRDFVLNPLREIGPELI